MVEVVHCVADVLELENGADTDDIGNVVGRPVPTDGRRLLEVEDADDVFLAVAVTGKVCKDVGNITTPDTFDDESVEVSTPEVELVFGNLADVVCVSKVVGAVPVGPVPVGTRAVPFCYDKN